MALPVITDVFRCTINGSTFAGIAPRNVIHVRASGATEEDVGNSIWNAMQTDQFGVIPGEFQAQTITVLPLDGTSPGVDIAPPEGWDPDSIWGPGDEDFTPEACAVISLRTAVRGPRGRGRVFLGPLREATQDMGFITASVPSLTAAWAGFVVAVADDTFTVGVASYKHASFSGITLLHADAGIGTQRRRLLQQR